jgi:hypothetical protein
MSKPSTSHPDGHQAATYEVRLQGHLDASWAHRLDVAGLIHESAGTTLMRVAAADQSALHGLLQRIRDLGLPLLSIARLGPADPDRRSSLPLNQDKGSPK